MKIEKFTDVCMTGDIMHRRKRFDIHLLTKMSDMTRRFEVIMTSFSSDKRNGQVQV